MELMINYSEILTVIIQSFLITVAGFIFVGCWNEIIDDIKLTRKTFKRKRGKRRVRDYTCPACGFSAWALDSIVFTNCKKCGHAVVTKPIPKVEKSFIFGETSKDKFDCIWK